MMFELHCSYYKNAKKTSLLLRDHPINPADTIRYWVDYVIRHNGAKHLRLESVYRLNWCQYWSLDVAALLLSVAVMVFYVVFRVILLAGRLIHAATQHFSIKWKIE